MGKSVRGFSWEFLFVCLFSSPPTSETTPLPLLAKIAFHPV